MKAQVNDRVGAILGSKGHYVEFLGYGIYQGEEIPPAEITFMGLHLNIPNPKILLDSGKVTWGCECWWGPERTVQAMLEGKEVVVVDIEQVRKDSNA